MTMDFLQTFCRRNEDKRSKKSYIKMFFFFIFLIMLGDTGINAQCVTPPNQIAVDGNPCDWQSVLTSTTIPFKVPLTDKVNAGNTDDRLSSGSKDVNDLPLWTWTFSSTGDKADIHHAGAAIVGNELCVFADRFAQNGDADLGFWFFKQDISLNPNGTFNGKHSIGDVLLKSRFTQGGGVSTIDAFQVTAINGTSVVLTLLTQKPASVNSTEFPVPPIFQPYNSKFGTPNIYPVGAFFEGKVNLTDIFNADECFSDFLVETGESQGNTEQLVDFVFGSFQTQPVVTLDSKTVCSGENAIFTATVQNGTGIAPFTFSFNGGAFTSSNTFTINNATSSAVITVVVKASNGCTSIPATGNLTVNPPAVSNAGVDQTVCASAATVTLAGVVSGSATTGTWSGGTGTFTPNANTLNAVYTPSAAEIAAGSVELTLTTNDPDGPCAAVNDKVKIFINPAATVNAGADQTVCASAATVTLTGVVGGSATSGTWSGGTGTFTPDANTLNAVYTPSAAEITAGSVELTLTTNDPAGPCAAVTDKVKIFINPAATVNAGADQTVCASAATVTLAGVVGGSATSGTWSGGTGTFTPNANTLNAVYTPSAAEIAAESVELTLTTNDPDGPCAAVTDKVKIFINPAATVNAGADQTVCASAATVTLTGVVGGSATSGTWSGGTGTFTPNANTLNATYTLSAAEVAAGFVELTLTTNDPAGPCGPVSDKVRIAVTNQPTVNAGPDQEVCASSPVVTLAGIVGGGATSGTWSGGTGTFNPNANTLNAVYTPSASEIAAGSVELTLTTNDPEGPCDPASDVMKITIHANPLLLISSVTPAACAGGTATAVFTVTGDAGPFNIFLDGVLVLNNVSAFPVQLAIPADGIDHQLKVVDSKGCETQSTVSGGIAPTPINFTLTPRAETCLGANDGCILVTISGGVQPYKVQIGNNASVQLAAGESSRQFCNLAPGQYRVRVTDANNCVVADQVTTVNAGVVCATGHCTYTQGQYGTFNGQACLPGGSSVLASDIMVKALDAEPNDFKDFGVVANNKYFRLKLSDVAGGSEANIYKMLPGGGNACGLKGFATFTQTETWANVPLSTKPQTFGKILNTLLAQAITLYFNLSEDRGLGSEIVQDTIITSSQTFCGSGIPQAGTETKFGFPHAVVVFLNNNTDAFDYPNTVAGLFKLANDILGGVNVPVNCTDVAAAVDGYNNAFDGCRIQTGSIPFVPASTINSSLLTMNTIPDQPASEAVKEVQVRAYPNPFSDKVNFVFVSPVKNRATLEIYNIAGQRMAVLFSGMVEAGESKTVQYTKGKVVANTILVYKLTIGDKVVRGKVQTID